jgi:hypothetical protein
MAGWYVQTPNQQEMPDSHEFQVAAPTLLTSPPVQTDKTIVPVPAPVHSTR